MHSDYGGSFVFGVTGHQKPFLIALRFAARKPAAQGKGLFFFLTQHLRASVCAKPRPRWLDVLGYSLPPLLGLVLSSSKVCSIPLAAVLGLKTHGGKVSDIRL